VPGFQDGCTAVLWRVELAEALESPDRARGTLRSAWRRVEKVLGRSVHRGSWTASP